MKQRITTVAWIGTGIMGAPMAHHLLRAGYHLIVHSRTKQKAQALIQAGAQWAEDVACAVRHADAVCTMLGYPQDVEDVYLTQTGILQNVAKDTWIIDFTTSSPLLAQEIHQAAALKHCVAFDCPVTGGETGAKTAHLTALIGAREQDILPVVPLISAFASKRFYFNEAGKAQVAKLCNQVSLASCMVGYADALALAKQSGLDTVQVIDMISSGMGSSRALCELAPKSCDGDYKPGFMVAHMKKDLSLALEHAQEVEVSLPGADTAYNLYDMLCDIGGKRLGTQAISLLYEDEAQGVAAGLDWSAYQKDSYIDNEQESPSSVQSSTDTHTPQSCAQDQDNRGATSSYTSGQENSADSSDDAHSDMQGLLDNWMK